MNGKVARRIRRAALQTMRVQFREKQKYEGYAVIHKRLLQEYRALPYHKRKGIGHKVLSHKEQEKRYRTMLQR